MGKSGVPHASATFSVKRRGGPEAAQRSGCLTQSRTRPVTMPALTRRPSAKVTMTRVVPRSGRFMSLCEPDHIRAA